MDRRTVITLGAILAIIGGAFAFLLLNSDAKQAMQRNLSESANQAAQETGLEPKKSAPGKYVTYTDTELAEAQGTKLIFFHASWCPQCRAIEKDIKQQGVPNGVTILKADYDTSQQLRQRYGVTIQTTIVKVDDQGNLVEKYVAYDEPSLDAIIKNLL